MYGGGMKSDRPPLGITPEWLFLEGRIYGLIVCLHRHLEYIGSHSDLIIKWSDELNRRLKEYREAKSNT